MWALPRRCSGDEANHIRNTITRLDETVGAEVFGKRKHVPFSRRQGIEPATALVDNDDDIGVAAVLDRTPGTFFEVDLPAVFLQQSCAANFFAQLLDCSLVHCLHRRCAGNDRPLLLLVWPCGTLPTGREACRVQGRADKLSNSSDSWRGEASLAAGMAPAATGYPAQ